MIHVVILTIAGDATVVVIVFLSLGVLNKVSFFANLLQSVVIVDPGALLQLMLLNLVVQFETFSFFDVDLESNNVRFQTEKTYASLFIGELFPFLTNELGDSRE